MEQFEGRVAVVTGAGSGIGRAYAVALAGLGVHLVLADIDGAALEAVAGELSDAPSVLTQATDVSDESSVGDLADAAFGRHRTVHLLCNNAGVSLTRNLLDATPADWDWMFGVNVKGVLHGISAFVPRMLEAGEDGHVVNTASLASWLVVPSYGLYAATKHAVAAITEALAGELAAADAPIGVTAVCPALVRTRLFSSERNRPEVLAGELDVDDDEQRRIDALTEGVQSPDEIARSMIDAVRAGRLWAFPSRGRFDAIRARFDDVLG